MKLTSEEFEAVRDAGHQADEYNHWVLIEEGDWIQNGKYQDKTNIVQDSKTGLYYRYSMTRHGSPFSDWYYDHEEESEHYLEEVKQQTKTITITEWV